MDDEKTIFAYFYKFDDCGAEKNGDEKICSRTGNVNVILEFGLENNRIYKCLEESAIAKTISQGSDKELKEITLVHTVTESEAAVDIIDDQRDVRRLVFFEEAINSDEELIINQEGLLLTSNEQEEPFLLQKFRVQEY